MLILSDSQKLYSNVIMFINFLASNILLIEQVNYFEPDTDQGQYLIISAM